MARERLARVRAHIGERDAPGRDGAAGEAEHAATRDQGGEGLRRTGGRGKRGGKVAHCGTVLGIGIGVGVGDEPSAGIVGRGARRPDCGLG